MDFPDRAADKPTGNADHLRIGRGLHDDAYVLAARGAIQSYVDLADPTHLEFPYIQRIGEVVDVVAPAGQPLRLVHLGGAGMTIPRYAEATRPGSTQLVFDPDEWMVALVLGHIPLPDGTGIEVRTVGGREGIADLPDECADVVVLDAYDGEVVPAALSTVEAFTEMARLLRPGGLLAANLADRAPFDWGRKAFAALTTVFPQVVLSAAPPTLAGERLGNLLAVASPDPASEHALDVASLADRIAQRGSDYLLLDQPEVVARFVGPDPFTDADPGL